MQNSLQDFYFDPTRRSQFIKQLLLTIGPACGWAALVLLRPFVIVPHCSSLPKQCSPEAIGLWIDRALVHEEIPLADMISTSSQNMMAALLLGLPLIWIYKQPSILEKRKTVASHILFVTSVTALNGIATETARLLVQRPRPYVWMDPIVKGTGVAEYTSFYSGHTSFVACATVVLWCIAKLVRPQQSWGWLLPTGLALLLLVTGAGRIYSGRHFPTDVAAAALAGPLIAFFGTRVWVKLWLANSKTKA